MRIFTRYLARKFFGPFLFGLGVFTLVVFLGDLFDKMNRLAASSAPLPVIGAYLLLQLPYWSVRIVPVATVLAALFMVSDFVRSGEFVAVQAAGFDIRPFFRPLLFMAAAIGAGAFLAQETVLPYCFSRSQHLWRESIHPEWEWDKYLDPILLPSPDRFVSAKEFVVKEGTLERPVMDDYDQRRLTRQVDAEWARWDGGRRLWVFERGMIRRFGETGALAAEESFEVLDSDLRVPPKALVPRQKTPDEMSLSETRREISRLESLGRSARWARTAWHQKIAYPFTNIVLCALGIPIALRLRRAKKTTAFAAALAVSFLYLWFIEMGWMLGKSGRLAPVFAAWMPNALFAVVAWRLGK